MAGQIAEELWHHQQQQHQLQQHQHQLQQLQLQYQHKEESAAVKSDIPSMGQSAPAPRLPSEEQMAVYQAAVLQYRYALLQIQSMQSMQSMQNLQGNSEEEKAVYQAAVLQYQYALLQIQSMQSMQNLQGNPYTQVKLILQFPLA